MPHTFHAFVLCFLLIPSVYFAQCGPPPSANCSAVPISEMQLSGPSALNFSFQELSQYYGGITYSGSNILRLKVDPINGNCKWSLKMIIDNNPAAPTPFNEWETLFNYGTGTTAPPINLLDVRVYNGCNTPISSGVYQTFPGGNGSEIILIDDVALIPAGSCITNVNGAGSYLTNYNEYTFTIDYRITPNLNYSPGIYQLSVRFCLVEDN